MTGFRSQVEQEDGKNDERNVYCNMVSILLKNDSNELCYPINFLHILIKIHATVNLQILKYLDVGKGMT
jgi:hypothetical protein